MITVPVVFIKLQKQTRLSRDRPAGNEGMFVVVQIGVMRHHHHHHWRLGSGAARPVLCACMAGRMKGIGKRAPCLSVVGYEGYGMYK